MIEDRFLPWRFKNGSEDALCRIYSEYRTRLLKLPSALSSDPDVAEDVVQDVFVSFAQSDPNTRKTSVGSPALPEPGPGEVRLITKVEASASPAEEPWKR